MRLNLVVSVLLLAGCATPYVLERQEGGVALAPRPDPQVLVGLSVSGGGSRAATFVAHVLEQLAQVEAAPGAQASVLERVQYISSVSGGSVASAYYALNKPAAGVPMLGGGGLSAPYADFFRR